MIIKYTSIEGVPDSSSVRPGMASYLGTGPLGSTCGTCKWMGYFKPGKDKMNKRTNQFVSTRVKTLGCKQFLILTHRHGPAVKAEWAACKYWERKNDH